LNDFQKDLSVQCNKVEDTKAVIALMRRQMDRTEFSLECAHRKYSELKSIDGESPSHCPTCKQSIKDARTHVHLEQELNACSQFLESLEKNYMVEKKELERAEMT